MTKKSEKNEQEGLFSLEDDVKVDVDVTALKNYKDELNCLLSEYANVVNPLIVEYEVEKNEFPIEILNEIRAIIGHIVRATATKNEIEVLENIKKAHSHVKRAALDGYKYLCVVYDDRYWDFYARYDTVDWVGSKLQCDIHNMNEKRKSAVELLRKAKNSEAMENDSQRTNITGQEHFKKTTSLKQMYKLAYEEYRDLYNMIFLLDKKIADLEQHNKLAIKRNTGLSALFGKNNKV